MPESAKSLRIRLVILTLAIALGVMLFTLIKSRILNPNLTIQLNPHELHLQASDEIITQDMDEISALMQAVGRKPHDINLILRLAENLLRKNQLEPAANFAKRAQLEDPRAFKPYFLLGIILHQQGKYQEAKEQLTLALKIQDDAACRYSLGILYCYFLKQPEQGIQELKAALQSPNITEELRQNIEQELAKQLKNP